MKKKELTEEHFINWWLEKYHDTNLDKIIEANPSWKENPPDHTREFYEAYQCTQEQHDEWYDWAIETVMKHFRWGKKRAKKEFLWTYLNVSPMIKQEDDGTNN